MKKSDVAKLNCLLQRMSFTVDGSVLAVVAGRLRVAVGVGGAGRGRLVGGRVALLVGAVARLARPRLAAAAAAAASAAAAA